MIESWIDGKDWALEHGLSMDQKINICKDLGSQLRVMHSIETKGILMAVFGFV